MRRILISLILGLFCNIIDAQTSVSGVVTDQKNTPLTGASVFFPEQNKGTVCAENGEYRIENLPAGKVKIQFSFMGFNTVVKTVILQKGSNEISVLLSEAVIESQEIVVTGGSVSSQHENAVKIDVLKSKDILLAGTPNFMESLTKVPGVDMIAKGQGVAKPVIRGLSMNDILILNNGVRIENYQFSENHPLGVDDNDVARVEVIKGPASLLYGSDAIGGVLNFIKEKPAPTDHIIGDYQAQFHSNTLGMSNSLGVKGASKCFSAGIRVSNKTHADYKQGGGDFVPNSRFNEWSVSANTGYTRKNGTFKVFYDYFIQELGMTVSPVRPLIIEQGRKNNIWYQDLKHHLISSQNKLFLGRFKWETNIACQSALRKLQTTIDVPVVEMNLNTLSYESKLYLPSKEKSEIILGIQGMNQTNRNQNNRIAQFLPDADVSNLGIVGLAQYTILKKLKLQGGLRFDIYYTDTYALGSEGTENFQAPVSKDFSSCNGSFGATYCIKEKLMLRANFAKAYRVPNLSELTSNGEHGSRYETGNQNLNPEDAYEADVSLHYHSDYLSFDLAGFYNQIANYIFIAPTSDTTSSGMDIFRFSQTNAILFGGEAGIHFHPKSVPWFHVKGIYSTVTGEQKNGDFLPFIPAQKFRYEIRAEKEKIAFFHHTKVWVSALSALLQQNPSPFETETGGYTLVNAGVNTEVTLKNQIMNIGLSVNNIFDVEYYDHLSTLKPLGYYNQGRNICLCLKVPFGIR
ncbi:MAG: TonB-dependent receptor [Bacteroidetes bacterium]|nr:TonB-dependent receptor [Bacteroidota bacterium]